MVYTRSMAITVTRKNGTSFTIPSAPAPAVTTAQESHYNLRPRMSKLIVTVPAGPYNLRPRVQFQ